MIEFANVEAALAKIHGVGAGGEISFRGRINKLKSMGVVRSSGGRGKRLAYSPADIWILAFCLELHEFEIGPTTVKRIVETWRPEIIKTFEEAISRPDNHLYLAFRADLLSVPPHQPDEAEQPMRWLQARWERDINPRKIMAWMGPRFGLINVTVLRLQIDAALPGLAPHPAVDARQSPAP